MPCSITNYYIVTRYTTTYCIITRSGTNLHPGFQNFKSESREGWCDGLDP